MNLRINEYLHGYDVAHLSKEEGKGPDMNTGSRFHVRPCVPTFIHLLSTTRYHFENSKRSFRKSKTRCPSSFMNPCDGSEQCLFTALSIYLLPDIPSVSILVIYKILVLSLVVLRSPRAKQYGWKRTYDDD